MKQIRKTEPFYRVSYTYILKTVDLTGKTSTDFQSFDKAIEYMNYKKSVGAGKDFTIEKVVTLYELLMKE